MKTKDKKTLYNLINDQGISVVKIKLRDFIINDDFVFPDIDDPEFILYFSFMNYYNGFMVYDEVPTPDAIISGFIQMNLIKGHKTYKK